MLTKDQRSLLLKARRSVKFGRAIIEEVKGEFKEYSLSLDEALRHADRCMDFINDLVETELTNNDKTCISCGVALEEALQRLGVCDGCGGRA